MTRQIQFAYKIRLSLMTMILLATLALIPSVSPNPVQSPWHVEVVDDGQGSNVGMFSSMTLDRNGDFQIAYYNATSKSLRYAYRGKNAQKWSRMTVAQDAGMFVSLATDAQGHAHLAYNTSLQTGLHYAYFDGRQWHAQIIDSVPTQFFASMQLDPAGNPRVTYIQVKHGNKSSGAQLKYAYSDGTTWFIKTVALRPHQGVYNSLAIDAAGHAHVAFAESGRLQYATWNASEWQYDTADFTGNLEDSAGLGTSLALDASEHPHITYFDTAKKTLKYAYREAGVWKTEVIEELSGTPKLPDNTSLRIDGQGQPHVAYYDGGQGVLKYAVRQDGNWKSEVVDHQGNVGMYPSLCLDFENDVYIAYYDSTDKQLRLAHREPGIATATKNLKP